MPRPLRILQNEYSYHVVTRTNGRLFKFRPSTYKLFISILNDISKKYDARIQHFQLMGNHYHLKILTPKANLHKIMHYFNGQIARRLNKSQGVKGHLWEQRYRSSIISTDEYAQVCVAYIYNNPVRAKLCAKIEDSKLLSTYNFYVKGKQIEFSVHADEVFLMMGRNELERRNRFKEFVQSQYLPETVTSIRKTLKNQFIGSADFVQKMRQKYSSHLKLN